MTISAPAEQSRGQMVWGYAAQIAALGVLVLACCWSPAPTHGPGALLALLTVGLVFASLRPNWHAAPLTSLCGSVALATLCWVSAKQSLSWPLLADAYVPSITPYVVGAVLVLLLWGAIARVGVFRQARFGAGALVGGVLLVVCSLLFYGIVNYLPAFHALYAIESYQLIELIGTALLYPAAIWLGEVSIRAANRRLSLLPIGSALILFAFLMHGGHQ